MSTEPHTAPCLDFFYAEGAAAKSSRKRAFDLFFATLLLVALSPLFVTIALLVRLTSSGPVFYIDRRIGMCGQPFRMLKFRTMLDGADKLKMQLMEHNEMQGPAFKMKKDPRITLVGAFLRKYSLDELPQLVNILQGDMSLIGPRPPLLQEYLQYETWQKRRMSVKPGATGLWQVSGRNGISDFNEWTKLDLFYIDHWSLGLDFKILLRTVLVVLKGTGY